MNPRAALLVAILGLFVASCARGAGQSAVHVNREAFDFARELIQQGQFVSDKKGAWRRDHPTRSQQSDFISEHGFTEYAKWFLAVDEGHAANRKARYKFPFGDFRGVHRCGLLAIKARAREYDYSDIEAAAAQLLEMVESAGPRAKKRVD